MNTNDRLARVRRAIEDMRYRGNEAYDIIEAGEMLDAALYKGVSLPDAWQKVRKED